MLKTKRQAMKKCTIDAILLQVERFNNAMIRITKERKYNKIGE